MSRVAGTVLAVLGAALLFGALTATVLVLRGDGKAAQPEDVDLAYGDPHFVTDQNIAFFQARVERDPADFVSYSKLGEAYIGQARETGDISAYERAETAFHRALEIRPDDLDSLAGLATVLYAKHDFQGSLAIAQRVFAEDSSATQALALIGDANLALGKYDAARTAYGTLGDAASGPSVLSRLSYFDELHGHHDQAIAEMLQAEQQAAKRKRSPETIAFYRLQLGGLYFNTGRYGQAEQWYQAALDVFPAYHQALAGLGNVEAARGHYTNAIDYYERSVAVVPQPSVLAALGDAYAHTGDLAAARQQYDTVEFIGQLAAINRAVYNRELAIFYADHDIKTGTAVELALAELHLRKDVFGYDAAAWALYKDGRPQEAAPLMTEALRLGTKDARMLYHAGIIAGALGQNREARAYLERALKINPHFSVLQEPLARQALARLTTDDALAEAGQ